jgi:hypothetical protein
MESKIIKNGPMASKTIPTTPKCPPYIAAKYAPSIDMAVRTKLRKKYQNSVLLARPLKTKYR